MTIKQQILDDIDAVFDAGLTLSITHTYGITEEEPDGTDETLKAFLDMPYERALSNTEIESASPSILLKTSDIGNIDSDSEFTINGTTYYYAEKETNQEGVTRIYISEDQI